MGVFMGLLVAIGVPIWLGIRAIKLKKELDRYEFENRTDGGVVQFKSFEDSERHKNKRKQIQMTPMFILYAIVGGIVIASGAV